MPKFNIYFTVRSALREIERPSGCNPVEADCLKDVIIGVAAAMPDEPNDSFIPVRVIAVRIEEDV
jgi:hypothetical protein